MPVHSIRNIPKTCGPGWMRSASKVTSVVHFAQRELSDGIMFPIEVDNKGRPIDAAWRDERINNEPLTEIHRLKGTSETNPQSSPNDEFANYEILNYLLGARSARPRFTAVTFGKRWEKGLAMEEGRGYNPYKMGVVGASDSHNTASGQGSVGLFRWPRPHGRYR